MLRCVCHPHISPANCLLLVCMGLLIAGSLACSPMAHRSEKSGIPLQVPECLIIRTDAATDDSSINAYKEVFDAVALNSRIGPPSEMEKLVPADRQIILVIPARSAQSISQGQIQRIFRLVESGAVLVTEGHTRLTETFGFTAGKTIAVAQLEELACPDVEIQWERAESIAILHPPEKAIVLNRDRKSGTPVVCLLPRGRGNCLVLAAELTPRGGTSYARFPYLLQELLRAGVAFPFRSERLTALYDYAYRQNEDPEELAAYWSSIGIRSIHAGTWYHHDGDGDADAHLKNMIDACHRHGILVYAWLELPHVSLGFWKKHPKWREKTATGRDAHVDWRYSINLLDPQCFKAVSEELEKLFHRFDWDGANLSELYFDTPSGKTSPEDFTPLNSIVRGDFKKRTGIDPVDFFRDASPNHWSRKPAEWQQFVDYRVKLERDLNERFIQLLGGFRNASGSKLDVVVTYVDNIYDPSMREAVGADVNVMFELLDKHDFTLVLEDPGTVWHLGPRRYAELAQTYSKLTRHAGRLGIDINIVNRDAQTYPTIKQSGTEFVQLFSYAGRNFRTVLVYSEQTMLKQDAPLVPYALAADARATMEKGALRTNAAIPVLYRSGLKNADFDLDGSPWPCINEGDVFVPAGIHLLSAHPLQGDPKPRLVKLNGDIVQARYGNHGEIEFSYNSSGPAIAVFDRIPKSLQVDGSSEATVGNAWNKMPRGSHKVLAVF